MADIAAGDVTYTDVSTYSDRVVGLPTRRVAIIKVVFGNGSLTYPSGGIPLTTNKMSMTSFVETVIMVDTSGGGDTKLWTWDKTNNKLRGYSAVNTELTGAVTASTLYVQVTGF